MELNPHLANKDFVLFCFSVATQTLMEKQRSGGAIAAYIIYLALTAEVYLEHGAAKVSEDVAKMKETHTMEPYLREWYKKLQQATDAGGKQAHLLSKYVPCKCLDDIRGISYVHGSERLQVCSACKAAVLKKHFQTCSQCKIQQYCTRECQEKDWPNHKMICKCLASTL
jgi:hypothetical protein